jgi:hypothetical protein
MQLLVILLLAAACLVKDWVTLRQKRLKRDLVVPLIFWGTGIAAVACYLYRINVPSPLLLIMMIYKPVNSLFAVWFYN